MHAELCSFGGLFQDFAPTSPRPERYPFTLCRKRHHEVLDSRQEDEVDSDHYAFQIYFPTLRRTDGTWFYDAAAIPGRTALRKKLAERFPSAEFIGSLSLLSEEDAPMKLRGNNGQFRLVLDGSDAVAFDRDFMDDEGHSLNPLWECRGFRGEDGGIDIPDDYADLDLNP